MPEDNATLLEEHLSCNFVLCASLYFRLAVIDARARDPLFFGWHGLLHDTARALSALSEPVPNNSVVGEQICTGAADLLHGLQDTRDLAEQCGETNLVREIRAYTDQLEAQIRL